MAKRATTKSAGRAGGKRPMSPKRRTVAAKSRDRWPLIVIGLVVALIVGLYVVYQTASKPEAAGTTPRSDYQVGSPGPGDPAPAFTLPSTNGGEVSLADYKGKNVLLYFHEGIGCQPCWDQIRDLDAARTELKTAGVDELLAITTGPVDLITQKVRDDRLTAVNLADPDLAVSRRYDANKYGMMGDSRDGHSFLVVGADGTIRWRADYGGEPKYTMYVPVPRLLADLKAGVE